MLGLVTMGARGEKRSVSVSRMTFEWRVDGDQLRGRMRAETRGWVAIGLNHTRELGGSRLVMGMVKDGRGMLEEHLADPPNHDRIERLGAKSLLALMAAREEDGATTVDFVLPLAHPHPRVPSIDPKRDVFLTLAYSHHDDLQHHSTMRTARVVCLA